MSSLTHGTIGITLERLHQEAARTDQAHVEAIMAAVEAEGGNPTKMIADVIASEQRDYDAVSRSNAEYFLAISPAYGRFLYMMARATGARRIVEFGTSMGISTIYLAAAVQDNGGGIVIGSELQSSKVARARANLESAELSSLADIREGDALETLKEVGGDIDLLLIDGAFALYLPVLKLVEPRLRKGAVVLGENAFDQAYLDYVRDTANGYLSQSLALDEGRGNEFAIRTR